MSGERLGVLDLFLLYGNLVWNLVVNEDAEKGDDAAWGLGYLMTRIFSISTWWLDEGGPKTFSLILFMFREHRLIEGAEDFFLCKIYWLIFEWRLFLQRTLDDRKCRRLFLVQNLWVDNRCLNQRQSGVTLCLEMNCRRTMKNHHTFLHWSSLILSEKIVDWHKWHLYKICSLR